MGMNDKKRNTSSCKLTRSKYLLIIYTLTTNSVKNKPRTVGMALDCMPQSCLFLLCCLYLGSQTVDSNMNFLKQTEVPQSIEVVEVKVVKLENPHMNMGDEQI
jgi:hypothetical protein